MNNSEFISTLERALKSEPVDAAAMFNSFMSAPGSQDLLSLTIKQYIMDQVESTANFDDAFFNAIYKVLDTSIELTLLNHLNENFVLTAIEDLFDMLPTQFAETFFGYIETRRDKLTAVLICNARESSRMLARHNRC
jgi:hypothetical protein